MSQLSKTIPKTPALRPAEDYYRLRREGVGFIEQMGSRLWTDYNSHDPGITILEALCYAMTDLAYRTGWDIRDILMPATPSGNANEPFPNQPFFTARGILTVNPWTPDDFRRLLIDLDMVRNAWVFCKECACDAYYYAWCEKDQLKLSYRKPDSKLNPLKVEPLGLYEILLELESDPELGDLNDRKIERTLVAGDNGNYSITLELRFPDPGLKNRDEWKLFLEKGETFTVKVLRFGANKTYDLLTDSNLDEEGRNKYLRDHWSSVLYADIQVALDGGENISIENAALRIFGNSAARSKTDVSGLIKILEDETSAGFVHRYRRKEIEKSNAVESAKAALHGHRNLDEDFCGVKIVGVEEVAVCADVELKPDADTEWVQARILFEVERYFNPPIPFYTLQELMESETLVDEIFNGPELQSGFIKGIDLESAELRTVLRTSDIINRLMDIEGVIAVNQLQLVKYDAEGNAIKGAADPTWGSDGSPIFDANKTGAYWLMYISKQCQPRLYQNASCLLFYKNGLPFRPRMDEVRDTLTQLRGEAERPKIAGAVKDLPIPAGRYRSPEDYYPVQYSFPLTYGIGPEGLPSHASLERHAQAKQLKAYLMVFEQLLGNAFAQIAHTADLFSLDAEVKRTYFVREFSNAIIQGYDEIINGLDKTALETITETEPEFHERRNRFLDHIMARFGEQFNEYALLLTNLEGEQVALDQLIEDKISFMLKYPQISHDRGKAFDYTRPSDFTDNQSGIKRRTSRLLGYPDIAFAVTAVTDLGVDKFRLKFQLTRDNKITLVGHVTLSAVSEAEARLLAYRALIKRMSLTSNYKVSKKVIVNGPDKFILKLTGNVTEAHGQCLFDVKADAESMLDKLVAWSANERMIVVEHLLLRPKFAGDALYPACTDGRCATCGDEDPYSFRMTFVMPGWTAPFNRNMEMRDFADRTIRQETPSHLVGKICWVGNDGFDEDLCDPVIEELAELIETGAPAVKSEDACNCAVKIYKAFSKVFREWFADKTLSYIHADTLKAALESEFNTKIDPKAISCTTALDGTLWADIQTAMVRYFHHIALYGWQFDRFEDAWYKWLEANAKFDWTEECLQERVEAILASNVKSMTGTGSEQKEVLCRCAAAILTDCGMAFYQWMDDNFKNGITADALEQMTFNPPDLDKPCPGLTLKDGAADAIKTFLSERYNAYKNVSYRLRVVVDLLGKLSNIYPPATLHDWDEGNDENPVRLGKTALGK